MIAGLDLAGKENPSGIAIFNKFNFECSEVKTDEEIIETLKNCKLVAIDAPQFLAKKATELKNKLEKRGIKTIQTSCEDVEKLIPEGLDNLGFSSNSKTEHEKDACLAGFSAWSYKFGMYKEWKGIITPNKRIIRMMRIQKKRAPWVRVEELSKAEKIAVADLSYENNKAICGIICEGEIIIEDVEIKFPYIPSLLAFRELKPIKNLIKELDFDLLFVNGHGLAHPRGLGMASHIGIELDKPTIGICKRLIVGELDGDKIMMNNNQVGYKHRSRYLTIGHRVSLRNVKQYADKAIELLQNIDNYMRK